MIGAPDGSGGPTERFGKILSPEGPFKFFQEYLGKITERDQALKKIDPKAHQAGQDFVLSAGEWISGKVLGFINPDLKRVGDVMSKDAENRLKKMHQEGKLESAVKATVYVATGKSQGQYDQEVKNNNSNLNAAAAQFT